MEEFYVYQHVFRSVDEHFTITFNCINGAEQSMVIRHLVCGTPWYFCRLIACG